MFIKRYITVATRYVVNKDYRFLVNASHGMYDNLSDEEYITRKFRARMGKDIDLQNPTTFNEKLQWLKLHDHNPLYIKLVDKYLVKDYVANIIGEEYIIPTLGVWERFEDIDFNTLPDQFVLKCTHDSGGLVICKDKKLLDIQKAKKKINQSLKRDYYLVGREWPYKDVSRKIIAEKFMSDDEESSSMNYMVHNFPGAPQAVLALKDHFSEADMTEDFFAAEWEQIPVKGLKNKNSKDSTYPPDELNEILTLSEKLSINIPFPHTDFYKVGEKAYFGEITFYAASGIDSFIPERNDEIFEDWSVLSDHRGGIILYKPNSCLYIHSSRKEELTDYKFMCFGGRVKCIFTCTDRFSEDGLKVTFYDKNWNVLPFERHYPKSEKPIAKPTNLQKMIELAERLSKDIPFVRVDFYETNGKIYFGELTFYPGNGWEEFTPETADDELGSWIQLPDK